jgi:hypothetical protein
MGSKYTPNDAFRPGRITSASPRTLHNPPVPVFSAFRSGGNARSSATLPTLGSHWTCTITFEFELHNSPPQSNIFCLQHPDQLLDRCQPWTKSCFKFVMVAVE